MIRRAATLAVLLSFALVLLLAPGCPREDQKEGPAERGSGIKIMIIGIDGADLDVIEPMAAAGDLPNMKRMLDEGASGKLKAIQPILSPLIWTTIATGRAPDEHGIRDFYITNPRTGEPLPANSLQRRCEAVWDILGNKGKTVGVVGWLATWPAEPVNGFLVTDRVGMLAYEADYREDDTRREKVYPESIEQEMVPWTTKAEDIGYDEFKTYVNVSEEKFRASYRRSFTEKGLTGNTRLLLSTTKTLHRTGFELYKKHRPDFFACYFELTDAMSHFYMPFAPPQRSDVTDEDYASYSNAVPESYRYVDRVIGEALDLADEDTIVLVMSDHGFRSGKRRLSQGSGFHDPHGTRWHRLYGTFMAWGKGVKKGVRIQGANVFDITPTVLGLMGYPAAKNMRGRFLADAFDVTAPEERIETYETDRMERILDRLEQGGGESKDDDQILAKLRALGYIGVTKTSSRDRLNVATFLISEGRIQEAEKEIRTILAEEPGNAFAYRIMADVCLRRSMGLEGEERERVLNEAAELLESSLRLENRLVQNAVALAQVRALLGQNEKAHEAAKLALTIDSESGRVQLFVAKVLRRIGRPAEAEAALLKAIALEPDTPEARRMLGKIHLARTEYKAASLHYEAALELEPGHVSARNELGVTYLRWATQTKDPLTREKRYDAAFAMFTAIIDSDVKYPKAFLNRAQVRLVRGQRDEAIKDLQRALDVDPEYVEARRLLAKIQRR